MKTFRASTSASPLSIVIVATFAVALIAIACYAAFTSVSGGSPSPDMRELHNDTMAKFVPNGTRYIGETSSDNTQRLWNDSSSKQISISRVFDIANGSDENALVRSVYKAAEEAKWHLVITDGGNIDRAERPLKAHNGDRVAWLTTGVVDADSTTSQSTSAQSTDAQYGARNLVIRLDVHS